MQKHLSWIARWLAFQAGTCFDGSPNWSDTRGPKISFLENPGWRVSIPIENTVLEGELFKENSVFRSEENWCVCCVRNEVFDIACGLDNLEEGLMCFIDWAKKHEPKVTPPPPCFQFFDTRFKQHFAASGSRPVWKKFLKVAQRHPWLEVWARSEKRNETTTLYPWKAFFEEIGWTIDAHMPQEPREELKERLKQKLQALPLSLENLRGQEGAQEMNQLLFEFLDQVRGDIQKIIAPRLNFSQIKESLLKLAHTKLQQYKTHADSAFWQNKIIKKTLQKRIDWIQDCTDTDFSGFLTITLVWLFWSELFYEDSEGDSIKFLRLYRLLGLLFAWAAKENHHGGSSLTLDPISVVGYCFYRAFLQAMPKEDQKYPDASSWMKALDSYKTHYKKDADMCDRNIIDFVVFGHASKPVICFTCDPIESTHLILNTCCSVVLEATKQQYSCQMPEGGMIVCCVLEEGSVSIKNVLRFTGEKMESWLHLTSENS